MFINLRINPGLVFSSHWSVLHHVTAVLSSDWPFSCHVINVNKLIGRAGVVVYLYTP